MDIEVQNYNSPFAGFVDDSEYGNFLGIHGHKYYANQRQEQAQATAAAAAAAAEEQKANAQKLAQAAKAQEDEAKAILKEQEAKLEQAQAQQKQKDIANASTNQGSTMSNKKLLIGGGIALAVIIGLVVVLK
jgi:hypothetical protein